MIRSEIVSRTYQPDPVMCCEACIFGRGDHADWCWPCIHCDRRLNLSEEMQQTDSFVRCACGTVYQTWNNGVVTSLSQVEFPGNAHNCAVTESESSD